MEKRHLKYTLLALDVHLSEVALNYTFNGREDMAEAIQKTRSVIRFMEQQVMDSQVTDPITAIEKLNADLRLINNERMKQP